MKKNIMKYNIALLAFLSATVLLTSCKEDEILDDINYPEQKVYIPAGIPSGATASNFTYEISSLNVPNTTFRYQIDGAKFNVPLTVYRSGVNSDGAVKVSVAARADTVTKLISLGKLSVTTEFLPADKYTISPTDLTIESGKNVSPFTLSVDLPFLKANPTKTYALAIGIASADRALGKNPVVVVIIKPAFLP